MKSLAVIVSVFALSVAMFPSSAEAYSFLMRPDWGYQTQEIYPEKMTEENRLLLRTYIRLGYCKRDMADVHTNVLYVCRQVVGNSTEPTVEPEVGLQNEVIPFRYARKRMSVAERVREARLARAKALENRGW